MDNEDSKNTINPFQAINSIEHFEEPQNYDLIKKAKIFTSTHYSDGVSWTTLEKPLNLRKTTFEDDKILTLNPIEDNSIPIELEASLGGKYDIKVYRKRDVILCIEGEQKILIKLPVTKSIITWNSSSRLPVLPKVWRPTIFILNQDNVFVRIIPEKCLVISKVNNKDSFRVECINFSDGFCCCHPINNLALLYGGYEQNQEFNVMKLPKLPLSNGKYNYFIHFFSWGTMIVPKYTELSRGILCNLKSNTVALLIIPPKIHISVELKSLSPISCSIDYKKDFLITARKPNITDIEIYLIAHDQLIKYNYSFDLRLNKENAPIANLKVPIKFKISKEEKEKKKKNPSHICKWAFDDFEDQKVLSSSSNSLSANHIMSPDLACIFDAETGIYYSTDYGIQHCKAFKKLQI